MWLWFLFLHSMLLSYECVAGIGVGDDCVSSFNCTQSDPGSECVYPDRKCVCLPGWALDTTTNNCRLELGKQCVFRDDCISNFTCHAGTCGCDPQDRYYNPYQRQCELGKPHAALCNQSDECNLPSTDCIQPYTGTSRSKRCLCWRQYYYNADTRKCIPVSNVIPRDIHVSSRLTTSIKISWMPLPHLGTPFSHEVVGFGSDQVMSVDSNGAVLYRLQPGSQYSFQVATSIPANLYYAKTTIPSTLITLWTKPATPGPYDESKSVFTGPYFLFVFSPPEGRALKYILVIYSVPGNTVLYTQVIFATNASISSIKPGRTYGYLIRSFNQKLDHSHPRLGIFTIKEKAPGAVDRLTHNKTSSMNSVTIGWGVPRYPNGYIFGFGVKVITENRCSQAFLLNCSDCTNVNTSLLVVPDCPSWIPGTPFTKADVVYGSNTSFTQTVSSLDPLKKHTFRVFAINSVGLGEEAESVDVKTDQYNNSSGGSNNGGIIAGVTVGIVVVICIGVGLIFFLRRSRRNNKR